MQVTTLGFPIVVISSTEVRDTGELRGDLIDSDVCSQALGALSHKVPVLRKINTKNMCALFCSLEIRRVLVSELIGLIGVFCVPI